MKLTHLIPLFGLSLLWTCPANAALELNFQSLYPPASQQNIQILKPWAESIEKLTNGEIIGHFYNVNGIVDTTTEAAKAVESGMLDIASWNPAWDPHRFPYGTATAIPFLGKNSALDSLKAFNAIIDQVPEVKKELNSIGTELFTWVSAVYGICSVKTPIKTVDDLKGKRVLVISPSESPLVEALGGVPVFVTPGDTYIGLQRGMGECFLGALPYQKSLRLFEVAPNLTVLPSTTGMMTTSINNDVLAEMTDAQKAILFDSVKDIPERLCRNLVGDAAAAIEEFKAAGGVVTQLSQEELAPFINLTKGVLESYWYPLLKKNGIEDPKALCEKYYAASQNAPAWE